MNDIIFDHDRLGVYRLSIKYVARSFVLAKELSGLHRHARDQWLRAAQPVPLNIVEGNEKRSLKDRDRFFDITRGPALECASIQDVLAVYEGIDAESHRDGTQQLKRIVSMLTKLIARLGNVSEPATQNEVAPETQATSTSCSSARCPARIILTAASRPRGCCLAL